MKVIRDIFKENTADCSKNNTDFFASKPENEYSFSGFVEDNIRFIEGFNMQDSKLWKVLVDQFRQRSDTEGGWRGEYWGKMMRGACFVYSYTKNEKLYSVLEETVKELISVADKDGKLSTYPRKIEFTHWDVWCRKYVLLGLEYFYEITENRNLKKNVLYTMKRHLDYITEYIGAAENKMKITDASYSWRGINSSSILEPVVRLYNITKEEKYLDFARHIVDCGGSRLFNMLDYAYDNKIAPYQYPLTKAYEMTSFFDGLLEYYRVTKDEKCKTAVLNYAEQILKTDFTVVGSAGCSNELFDHSSVRQANTTNEKVMQETCVTVTLMKFFYQILCLTGDSKYADAFECSMYNAYFGALNTENKICKKLVDENPDLKHFPLPVDSYSPLTKGTRGVEVGGFRRMKGDVYYGCCAAIGALGAGIIHKAAFLNTANGYCFNLYINGEYRTKNSSGEEVVFSVTTNYPKDGAIRLEIKESGSEELLLMLRNPEWSKKTEIKVNGINTEVGSGFIKVKKSFCKGDIIELKLDMRTEVIRPIPYGTEFLMNNNLWWESYVIPTYDTEDEEAKKHIALRRGPIILAQDSRISGDLSEPANIKIYESGYVDAVLADEKNIAFDAVVAVNVPCEERKMCLVDYASAGKLWSEESEMAAWIRNKA